jgi:hypothetical protein
MIKANNIWKFIYLYALSHLIETLYKRSILYLILIDAAITCLIVIYVTVEREGRNCAALTI